MADTLESPHSSLQQPPSPPSTMPPAPALLPDLPYQTSHTHYKTHKKSIATTWTLLALDAAIMPLALFHPPWYASGLAPAYIFAVITGLFGITSGLEWAYRSRQLWKKENVRPFGGKRNGVRFVPQFAEADAVNWD